FDSGTTILFEGTADDTEDLTLSAADLAWTSDLDGEMGTGGSFWTTLSDGNHTITASATDSGGKTGSASISITVGSPPAGATTVSVSSVSYATEGGKNKDKHLLITVALKDDLGDPVANASVSIDLYRDVSFIASGTATTGAGGTVTFTLKNASSGCYTTTVTAVSAAGLAWDGLTPLNELCK
ncbi:MAG: proprotein convertase P, partial [Candidatus Hydrogenedentes bacterium]|nr:proprotein convertase P [Candidatus Hydrogenedentota bacterium]